MHSKYTHIPKNSLKIWPIGGFWSKEKRDNFNSEIDSINSKFQTMIDNFPELDQYLDISNFLTVNSKSISNYVDKLNLSHN